MKKIQFQILSNRKSTEKRLFAIKKENSSFEKAVYFDSSNGYYTTDERTWKYIKTIRDIDVIYVGELDENK